MFNSLKSKLDQVLSPSPASSPAKAPAATAAPKKVAQPRPATAPAKNPSKKSAGGAKKPAATTGKKATAKPSKKAKTQHPNFTEKAKTVQNRIADDTVLFDGTWDPETCLPLHGEGTFSNGMVCVGSWEKECFIEGIKTNPDGTTYHGTFYPNKAQPLLKEGKIYRKTGQLWYDGKFKVSGKRHAIYEGKTVSENNSEFIGTYKPGGFFDVGTFVNAESKHKSAGQFHRAQDGRQYMINGTITLADGPVYTGKTKKESGEWTDGTYVNPKIGTFIGRWSRLYTSGGICGPNPDPVSGEVTEELQNRIVHGMKIFNKGLSPHGGKQPMTEVKVEGSWRSGLNFRCGRYLYNDGTIREGVFSFTRQAELVCGVRRAPSEPRRTQRVQPTHRQDENSPLNRFTSEGVQLSVPLPPHVWVIVRHYRRPKKQTASGGAGLSSQPEDKKAEQEQELEYEVHAEWSILQVSDQIECSRLRGELTFELPLLDSVLDIRRETLISTLPAGKKPKKQSSSMSKSKGELISTSIRREELLVAEAQLFAEKTEQMLRKTSVVSNDISMRVQATTWCFLSEDLLEEGQPLPLGDMLALDALVEEDIPQKENEAVAATNEEGHPSLLPVVQLEPTSYRKHPVEVDIFSFPRTWTQLPATPTVDTSQNDIEDHSATVFSMERESSARVLPLQDEGPLKLDCEETTLNPDASCLPQPPAASSAQLKRSNTAASMSSATEQSRYFFTDTSFVGNPSSPPMSSQAFFGGNEASSLTEKTLGQAPPVLECHKKMPIRRKFLTVVEAIAQPQHVLRYLLANSNSPTLCSSDLVCVPKLDAEELTTQTAIRQQIRLIAHHHMCTAVFIPCVTERTKAVEAPSLSEDQTSAQQAEDIQDVLNEIRSVVEIVDSLEMLIKRIRDEKEQHRVEAPPSQDDKGAAKAEDTTTPEEFAVGAAGDDVDADLGGVEDCEENSTANSTTSPLDEADKAQKHFEQSCEAKIKFITELKRKVRRAANKGKAELEKLLRSVAPSNTSITTASAAAKDISAFTPSAIAAAVGTSKYFVQVIFIGTAGNIAVSELETLKFMANMQAVRPPENWQLPENCVEKRDPRIVADDLTDMTYSGDVFQVKAHLAQGGPGSPLPPAAFDTVLARLDKTSREYKQAAARFYERFSEKLHPIACIDRVQNFPLYEKYAQHKRQIARENGGDANEIRWLVHGTRATDPSIICESGFDPRYSDFGLFGRAAYFAFDTAYSHHFRHPVKNAAGKEEASQLFLAAVTCGKVNYRPEQDKTLRHPDAGHHSVQGAVKESMEAVMVYELHQAYPEYLITYRNVVPTASK